MIKDALNLVKLKLRPRPNNRVHYYDYEAHSNMWSIEFNPTKNAKWTVCLHESDDCSYYYGRCWYVEERTSDDNFASNIFEALDYILKKKLRELHV